MKKLLTLATLLSITATTFAQGLSNLPVPEGFTLKTLEATDGKIFVPDGWKSSEAANGPSIIWTFFKDGKPDGSYDTGVKIQMIFTIKEMSGDTPEKFIQNLITQKKESAQTVFRECPTHKQRLFNLACIETEEGPHRILYSLFWNNASDVAIIVTAGTKTHEWDQYKKTFDTMAAFEPLNPKKFR